jgi:hypothetical protein
VRNIRPRTSCDGAKARRRVALVRRRVAPVGEIGASVGKTGGGAVGVVQARPWCLPGWASVRENSGFLRPVFGRPKTGSSS